LHFPLFVFNFLFFNKEVDMTPCRVQDMITEGSKDMCCHVDKPRHSMAMDAHLLVEMWQSPFHILANATEIEGAFLRLANGAKGNDSACDITIRSHQFKPHGVSATVSSPHAHVVIHTWPENQYAAVDIYANGREKAYEVLELLKEGLTPGYISVTEMHRGQLLYLEDT
jgi:S-adenosylmethionine decarboxylase